MPSRWAGAKQQEVDGLGLWVNRSLWNMVESLHTSALSSSGEEGELRNALYILGEGGVGWDCVVVIFL